MDNTQQVPVNEGEEFDVTIEAVGDKGDGIAKVKGFVIFVPDTQKGDHVRIRVTKVLKSVGFGQKLGPAEGGKQSKPSKGVEVDDETGKEKIVGDTFEAEYDPEKDSEEFGEE